MDQDEIKIVKTFADKVAERYKYSLQRVTTTGKSERSIRVQLNPYGVNIYAGKWFPAIEYGRDVYKGGNQSAFFKNLLKWVEAKRGFLKEGANKKRVARTLQIAINNKATRTFRIYKNRGRGILDVKTDDLERKLKEDLRLHYKVDIFAATLNQEKFKFVKVNFTKR